MTIDIDMQTLTSMVCYYRHRVFISLPKEIDFPFNCKAELKHPYLPWSPLGSDTEKRSFLGFDWSILEY